MNSPKISIIIPTLNVEGILPEALNSIFNQDYKNLEVILVDSVSDDGTLAVIEKYAAGHGFIRYISEKDSGLYDAMNKGIDLSTGDWLYFMGADDRFYDNKVLKDIYDAKMFKSKSVVYGNVYVIGDNPWAKDKSVYDGEFDLEKLLQKNICHQAMFYPRHIIKDIGYFNQDYTVTADYDYNLRCFSKYKFKFIDRIIAYFNSGGVSSKSDNDIGFKEFAENIFSYFKIDITSKEQQKIGSPFHKIIKHYNYIKKTQLNPFLNTIKEGISLFTAVKNRTDLFEEALKTWIVHEKIDEIIVVDWSSDKSIIPVINKYQNGKIFLADVKGQDKWMLAPAFNLAARLTTRTKILKIDADVKILPGFFENHQLSNGVFFAGNWEKARNENETHLNGNLFVYRNDFFKVNGYNEFFKTYGWDDTDLFERLVNAGLKRKSFNFDTLYHIEHEGRMAFQSPSKRLKNLSDEEWSRINIFINRYISKKIDAWSEENQFIDFNINIEDDNIMVCKQLGEDVNQIPQELIYEAELDAIKERLTELRLEFPEDILKGIDQTIFYDYYNLFLEKKVTKSKNHLFDILENLRNSYLSLEKSSSEEVSSLKADIESMKNLIVKKNKLIDKHEIEKSNFQALLARKNKMITEKDNAIEQKKNKIKEQGKKINSQVKFAEEKVLENKKLKDTITKLKNKLFDKERKIKIKEKEANKIKDILETTAEKYRREIAEANQQKRYYLNLTRTMDKKISSMNQALLQKDQRIKHQVVHIHSLIHQINEIYSSVSWRIGNFIPRVLSRKRTGK